MQWGTLVGRTLPEDECARVEALQDLEIVLEQGPQRLLIKLRNPKHHFDLGYGEDIYPMAARMREWSRDNAGFARVKRLGFAVVPEFGGTIHGYCGETLDANLLDLLEWHRKPTVEDMQKAYVGRSRTRRAHHMLLVQAYSPHLFRQGRLPGPTELMKVLRRTSSTAEAKKAWEKSRRSRRARKKGLG